jgi:flagellar basal body-associated protein FliL
MELITIIALILLLVIVFVSTQVVALFFLLREHEKLREENEKFQPPF